MIRSNWLTSLPHIGLNKLQINHWRQCMVRDLTHNVFDYHKQDTGTPQVLGYVLWLYNWLLIFHSIGIILFPYMTPLLLYFCRLTRTVDLFLEYIHSLYTCDWTSFLQTSCWSPIVLWLPYHRPTHVKSVSYVIYIFIKKTSSLGFINSKLVVFEL